MKTLIIGLFILAALMTSVAFITGRIESWVTRMEVENETLWYCLIGCTLWSIIYILMH